MSVQTWINGARSTTLSIQDRGLHYGDGVFETVAVCGARPLLWQAHWQRLRAGCARLGIALDTIEAELGDELEMVCRQCQQGVLKIIITRGASARGYASHDSGPVTRIMQLSPWPESSMSYREHGIRACVCRQRLAQHKPGQGLAGIKHLNRLEQVLARREWRDEYQEGVLCDGAGNVIEGVMSNLFLVTDNVLITPDLTYCGIEGVMRAEVLAQAQAVDIPRRVSVVDLKAVENADEVFFTNSIIGIWPLRELLSDTANREYTVGPLTRLLQQTLKESICGAS